MGGAQWVDAVNNAVDDPTAGPLVTELAVEPMRVDDDVVPRYIGSVLARLQEVWVGRQIADIKSKLRRMSPTDDADAYNGCSATRRPSRRIAAACLSRLLDPVVEVP